jgi:uncharacterized protein with NRDE domain
MCTVVLSFDPDSPVPMLLVGVRDEFLDRAWAGPDRHWPRCPELVGGRDLLAGGTWLAVNAAEPRAACVLNGHGKPAAGHSRRSRGELPLRLAAGTPVPEAQAGLDLGRIVDLERYDPFHLLRVAPAAAQLWSWDGVELMGRVLRPGLHMVVNSGLEGTDEGVVGPGAEQMRARIAHFRPLLAAADRPRPQAGPAAEAWGGWLALADGAGLDPADARALLVRADHQGRAWGTSSVSLVALAPDHVRYDFRAVQAGAGTAGGWTTVLDAQPVGRG